MSMNATIPPAQYQMPSFGAPGGVTYFANVLLELGFHVYNAPYGPWFDRPNGKIFEISRQIERTAAIPYFLTDPLLSPIRAVDIAWSHQWATPSYAGTRAIVGIRDPRQALFSQWRRTNKSGRFAGDYRKFLETPYYYLGFSPVDEWVLWHALWLNRPGGGDFVLRFEQAKSDPVAAFRPLLEWMGQTADDDAIRNAAARSSVERAREADPAGGIVVKGALRDFDAHSDGAIEAIFNRSATPIFETLELPADMRDLPRAVESLAARFDGMRATDLIALARAGLFTDLRAALAATAKKGPFELQLQAAIKTLDRLFATPVFPHLNHQDPALSSSAAAVIGTLARSATPDLNLKIANDVQARPLSRRLLTAARRLLPV